MDLKGAEPKVKITIGFRNKIISELIGHIALLSLYLIYCIWETSSK